MAEIEARLVPSSSPSIQNAIAHLPYIAPIPTNPNGNVCPTSKSTPPFLSSKDAFLHPPNMEGKAHSILRGLENLGNKLGSNQERSIVSKIISEVLQVFSQIKDSLSPYPSVEPLTFIERYSSTRDWKNSPIRALRWHPQTSKIAVALSDDSIQIHCLSLIVSPILKYKLQKSVSCLAWRPFSSSELAVGTESGILIWVVDPSSVVARPSASCVTKLSPGRELPISSLEYDPSGQYLLACSPSEKDITIWNTWKEDYVILRRFSSGGYHTASWSPCGRFAFTASTSNKIRLWNVNQHWSDEVWNIQNGYVNSAVWSPCGKYLLFSTSEASQLFCITFGSSGESASAAVPIVELTFDEEDFKGQVQSIKWDNIGERLAVGFHNSDLIALFCSSNRPILSLSLIGLIRGEPEEYPIGMDFHYRLKETDSTILTIGWSSGRIQHFPMIYTSIISEGNISLDITSHQFKPELFSSPL
ncbi:aladin [Lepeophtheirus salmonis]|nr:aladin-like [Lepeophtheirus salmonis]